MQGYTGGYYHYACALIHVGWCLLWKEVPNYPQWRQNASKREG